MLRAGRPESPAAVFARQEAVCQGSGRRILQASLQARSRSLPATRSPSARSRRHANSNPRRTSKPDAQTDPQLSPDTATVAANPPRERPVIAIDGPAGAGKSTLAAHLARRFGFLNLETGAMYRALALKAIENDFSFDEEEPLLALALSTRIELQPQLEGNRVLLDGMDVSRRIREPDVTSAASRVSVHPHLRAWMVEQQRALGAQGGVVMEGRDIGTKVFPDAEVKIFLDAAPEVRGDRRYRQVIPRQITIAVRPNRARIRTRKLWSSKAWPSKLFWTRCASATSATANGPNRRSVPPLTP